MAQLFSFGFQNDDIEVDSQEHGNDGDARMDVDSKEQPALLPPQLHTLDELVSLTTRWKSAPKAFFLPLPCSQSLYLGFRFLEFHMLPIMRSEIIIMED
jgi:hypothetical protein